MTDGLRQEVTLGATTDVTDLSGLAQVDDGRCPSAAVFF
jgi:hypothetical protein